MTQEEIKKILPHRDKMLLVDEAELCQDSLTKRPAHPLPRQLHHPGRRVVFAGALSLKPHCARVVQCEMMAQTCCVLLASKQVEGEKITPYLPASTR